jgi:outer membrane lipoprotein-sorting protein
MIWKYETPDKTQMLVTNKAVSFYFPSLEQIEVYRMDQGKGAAPFFFAFEATVEEIKENFIISGPAKNQGLNRVELLPKTDPLASEVKNVVLWLSEKDYLPRKILITEVTGDTTEITFSNIEINRPISDKELQLDAPEGTEVIEGDESGL